MLEGWYCRTMANANMVDEDDEPEESKYKNKYKILKRKLKYLIYENECFQDALRSAQKRLLQISRDRSFLLDRLLQYEKIDISTSESEDTESSDDPDTKVEVKKRKIDSSANNGTHSSSKSSSSAKKKRPPPPKPKPAPMQSPIQLQSISTVSTNMISDGHMTPEEVERHLQSRQTYLELVPEKAPPTVPTEMFSNDPSLDSESNDIGELETSPSNMGEDLSIDMIAE